MKFSKTMLLVCTLLSAQQVSLFAKEGAAAALKDAGLSASNLSDVAFLKTFMTKSMIPGQLTQGDFEQAQAAKLRLNNLPANKKTDEIFRLLERVQPVVERGMPEYVVTEQVEAGGVQPTRGPDILKPTVTMMMNYLSKPADQRTAKDYDLAKRAYAAFGKYVDGTLQADAPRFIDMSKMADAKYEFIGAVREMMDSNWNIVTNRPIAKNKYENLVVVAGAKYLSFGKDNVAVIGEILRSNLAKRIKNTEVMNEYVNLLMLKMASIQAQGMKQIDWQGMTPRGMASKVGAVGGEVLSVDVTEVPSILKPGYNPIWTEDMMEVEEEDNPIWGAKKNEALPYVGPNLLD